ncbi:LOW QUALITY PROTEIN: hypothetical protein U9M48_019567, partial [Paspalum notatum var. saurae]
MLSKKARATKVAEYGWPTGTGDHRQDHGLAPYLRKAFHKIHGNVAPHLRWNWAEGDQLDEDAMSCCTDIRDSLGHNEPRKEDLVTRRLWEKSNMERYIAEVKKESKRR